MSKEAMMKAEGLMQIANSCFVKPFYVSCSYTAKGAIITCHMKTAALANALCRFLKANGEQDVMVKESRWNGGEQHEVIVLIEN